MTRHEAYWMGYRHGRRIAQHDPLTDHHETLKLEVRLSTTDVHRAWSLGELRGWRQTWDPR